eukprot:Pgem_evm1s16536
MNLEFINNFKKITIVNNKTQCIITCEKFDLGFYPDPILTDTTSSTDTVINDDNTVVDINNNDVDNNDNDAAADAADAADADAADADAADADAADADAADTDADADADTADTADDADDADADAADTADTVTNADTAADTADTVTVTTTNADTTTDADAVTNADTTVDNFADVKKKLFIKCLAEVGTHSDIYINKVAQKRSKVQVDYFINEMKRNLKQSFAIVFPHMVRENGTNLLWGNLKMSELIDKIEVLLKLHSKLPIKIYGMTIRKVHKVFSFYGIENTMLNFNFSLFSDLTDNHFPYTINLQPTNWDTIWKPLFDDLKCYGGYCKAFTSQLNNQKMELEVKMLGILLFSTERKLVFRHADYFNKKIYIINGTWVIDELSKTKQKNVKVDLQDFEGNYTGFFKLEHFENLKTLLKIPLQVNLQMIRKMSINHDFVKNHKYENNIYQHMVRATEFAHCYKTAKLQYLFDKIQQLCDGDCC